MWLRCIKNNKIRYLSTPINGVYFEDDGKMSGKKQSTLCWYKNYVPVYEYDKEKFKTYCKGRG